jgi:hypothetical protein
MNQLIEFNVFGGSVLVESSEEAAGGLRGAGQLVEKIGRSLEDTLGIVRPIANAALAACHGLAVKPDTVEVEFGLKFNASVGAMIASTSTEGNLRMKLVLKPS